MLPRAEESANFAGVHRAALPRRNQSQMNGGTIDGQTLKKKLVFRRSHRTVTVMEAVLNFQPVNQVLDAVGTGGTHGVAERHVPLEDVLRLRERHWRSRDVHDLGARQATEKFFVSGEKARKHGDRTLAFIEERQPYRRGFCLAGERNWNGMGKFFRAAHAGWRNLQLRKDLALRIGSLYEPLTVQMR